MIKTRATVVFFEGGRQIAYRTLSQIPYAKQRVTLFGQPYVVERVEHDPHAKQHWRAARVHVLEAA